MKLEGAKNKTKMAKYTRQGQQLGQPNKGKLVGEIHCHAKNVNL